MRSLGGRIAIVALAALFSACAAVAPVPQPAPPAEFTARQREALVAHMMKKMAQRNQSLESLQTEAIMSYTSPDQQRPKVREQVSAKRPDSLRVEAMSALSVALILVANGKNLTIFEPSRNKLVRADATADTLNQFIRIPMAPADVVTLLLGITPDAKTITNHGPYATATEGDMTVAAWNVANSRCELGFQDDQLVMVRMRSMGGAIEYEVHYRDYHDIGGVMFPYLIDATFPQAQSHLVLQYKRPIINGQLPASAFVLAPQTAGQQTSSSNAAL
jgi:outer membrane lipoprotein-sorting protein